LNLTLAVLTDFYNFSVVLIANKCRPHHLNCVHSLGLYLLKWVNNNSP